MNNLTENVVKKATHSKEKSDEHGEVFTPVWMIEQMCDVLPNDFWTDGTLKWLDPCAGKGNMPAVIVTRLMETLNVDIEDVNERYRHIMECMIYMCEYQKESAQTIEDIFNPNGNIKLNLYFGDTLKMPFDFFDITYEERFAKYPDNCIHPRKVEITTEKITETKPIKKDSWLQSILDKAKKLKR